MIDRGRLGRAATLAVAAAALLTWTGQAQEFREPPVAKPAALPEFVEADCPMSFDRVRSVQIDCGYLSVLEDRGNPNGNVIRLAVARLRGSSRSPRPDPVIYLEGGPGVSALESIDWSRRTWSILRQRCATKPTTSTATPTGRRWRSR